MFIPYGRIIETNITAVEGSQIYWDVVNLSGATSCVNNIVVLDIIC